MRTGYLWNDIYHGQEPTHINHHGEDILKCSFAFKFDINRVVDMEMCSCQIFDYQLWRDSGADVLTR